MALDSFRVSLLDAQIRAAGVPINGVSVVDISATPPNVVVQFQPSATAEQIALGNQIKDAFDWRRRRPIDRQTVVTAFLSLTTAQQNTVLRNLLMEYARNNPNVVALVNQANGLNLTVDEIDPN